MMQSVFQRVAVLGLATILANLPIFALDAHADQYVEGYCKKNGKCVKGYWRSSPDKDPTNNWSYPGNVNPRTGKTATGDASTYITNLNDQVSNSSNDKAFNVLTSAKSTVDLSLNSPCQPTSATLALPQNSLQVFDLPNPPVTRKYSKLEIIGAMRSGEL
jgi:hypothetical protein